MKISSSKLRSVLGDDELVEKVRVVASRSDGRDVWTFYLKGSRRNGMNIYLYELIQRVVTIDEIYDRLVELYNTGGRDE